MAALLMEPRLAGKIDLHERHPLQFPLSDLLLWRTLPGHPLKRQISPLPAETAAL